jgi:hypothetical protein
MAEGLAIGQRRRVAAQERRSWNTLPVQSRSTRIRSHQDRGPSDVLAGLRTLALSSFKDSRLVMTTLDAMLYIV